MTGQPHTIDPINQVAKDVNAEVQMNDEVLTSGAGPVTPPLTILLPPQLDQSMDVDDDEGAQCPTCAATVLNSDESCPQCGREGGSQSGRRPDGQRAHTIHHRY